MKKNFLMSLCSAVFLFCSVTVHAQTATLDKVLDVKLENSVEIKNNGAIVGYAFFYKVEGMKKAAMYRVEILDENLKPLGSNEFEGSKELELTGALYESGLILLAFDDPKKKDDYEKFVKIFDLQGKEKGLVSYDPEKVKKGMFGAAVATQMEAFYNGVSNVEGKGFVLVYQSKSKDGGADIQMINTNGKLKWEKNLASDGERMDVYLSATTPNALLFFAAIRKNIMARDASVYLIGLNPDNGKEMFRKPMDPKAHSYEPTMFKTDANGNLKMVSLLANKDGKFYTSLPVGFSVASLNDKTGEIKIDKDFFYENELSSVLNMKSESKSEEGFMKIHNLELLPDGSKVVVGEFFRRTVSVAGAALKALSRGSGTASQVSIGDMFFLRIDANNKVVAMEKVEKNVSRVPLPGDGISIGLISRWLDFNHAFSYMYTDDAADPGKKTVVARGSFEGEGYGTTAITFDKNKGFTKKKFELVKDNRKDKTWVMRGKPGHLLLMKYNAKEKKISMNLERVQS